jgi:hypothetical protein
MWPDRTGYFERASADAKLDVLTQVALTGPFGLLGEKDAVWPIFHVIRALAAMAGRERYAVSCDRPESVQGVAVEAPNGGVIVWLANLTHQSSTIRINGALDSGELSLRSLDAASWRAASTGGAPVLQSLVGGTLLLAPFAIVQVDEIP